MNVTYALYAVAAPDMLLWWNAADTEETHFWWLFIINDVNPAVCN